MPLKPISIRVIIKCNIAEVLPIERKREPEEVDGNESKNKQSAR